MLRNIKNVMFLLVFFSISFFYVSLAVGQGAADWLNEGVTIRFQDKPMSTVLGKISQQTGIAILYDENLAGEKVTGSYKNVKFSEAINRLFSEKNKSIQVFKTEKKIIVKTFGAKQFILAGRKSITDSATREDESEKVSLAEIEEMLKQEYKEYKESLADENEVLEGGSMTRAQVKERIRRDNAQFKKELTNKDQILEGGKTRAEVEAIIKQEREAFKKSLADDSEILPGGGGMTRGQLRALIEKDRKAYEESLAGEDTIIEGGMTRGQVRELIEKDRKAYEEKK